MIRYALLFGSMLAGTALGGPLKGGPYKIYPLDINAGGTRSTAAEYAITASTGQAGGVGVIASAPYEASDGFWRGAAGNALLITQFNDVLGDVVRDPNGIGYEPNNVVTLAAIPSQQGEFRHWEIYDPNHRGDANYVVIDTNNPTTLVIKDDHEVTAVFGCTSVGGTVVLLIVALGSVLFRRRLR